MKDKDAKENAKDRREEGKGREPADRIFVNEFKPYKISDKCDDDRLIEEGGDDIKVNLLDPCRLKDDAHNEQDGD